MTHPLTLGIPVHSLKYALRQLRRSPVFTGVAVVTLCLCLAANLILFSIVDGVLLKPLPFPDADRLVVLYNSYPKIGRPRGESSYLNYASRQGALAAFSQVSLFEDTSAIVGEPGSTAATRIIRVSPEFFATVGVHPALGRMFTASDVLEQKDTLAILTDEFWRRNFNGDPAIIGRTVRVEGLARTIVGVLPAGFRFLSSDAVLYLPLPVDQDALRIERLHNGGYEMIGRLKPGVSMAEAQAQVDAHNDLMNRDFPYAKDVADSGFRTHVTSLHDDHVRSVRTTLWLLQGGVLCLLLVGGVNLVHLLLIRTLARTPEFAIRQSLGASWRGLVGQVVLEVVLLVTAGGVLGFALTALGIRLLGLFGIERLPLGTQVEVNGRLVLATLGGMALLGVTCVAPVVWCAVRVPLDGLVKAGSRSSTRHRLSQKWRHGFVVTQIALAFVLLSGAGLLGVSLRKVLAVSPGFQADHVLTGHLALPSTQYPDPASRVGFVSRLLEAVRSIPGVVSAGVCTQIPMHGAREFNVMRIPGHSPELANPPILHHRHGVAGDYFPVMGIPLREGRFLDGGDSLDSKRVCVVDEEFARTYWPGQSALGKHVSEGPDERQPSEWFTVVGVVGAVKQSDVTEDTPGRAVYLPFRHNPSDLYVVVRTSFPPELLSLALEKQVRELDPELPLADIQTMDLRIENRLVGRRSPALLATLFAAVALILAAVGTYGVLASAVAQRRGEIGLRMALGATRGHIGRQFMGMTLRLMAAGIVVGTVGSWWVGRFMQGILFSVPAFHLPTLLTVFLTISAVSVVAGCVPSFRAARTDPLDALKSMG